MNLHYIGNRRDWPSKIGVPPGPEVPARPARGGRSMVFVPIVVRSRSLGEAHESRLAISSCEMALQVMTRWISGTCHAGDVVGGVLTCAAPHVGPNAPQPPEKHAHRVRKAWLGRSMGLFRSTGRFRGWNPQGVALPARREARIVHEASLRQALSLSPSVSRRCRGDRRHLTWRRRLG